MLGGLLRRLNFIVMPALVAGIHAFAGNERRALPWEKQK
jgi:hypothetical protein